MADLTKMRKERKKTKVPMQKKTKTTKSLFLDQGDMFSPRGKCRI